MGRELSHTPKQRRDLHERLINSMERKADVFVVRAVTPEASAPNGDPDEPGLDVPASTAPSADVLRKTEDDFQQAIKMAAASQLPTKFACSKESDRTVSRGGGERAAPLAVGATISTVSRSDRDRVDQANSTLDILRPTPGRI